MPSIPLDLIIDAHGGMANWNKFDRVIATLAFGGAAFQMKFNGKGRTPRRFIISLGIPMVVIEHYPCPGQLGIFTPPEVWIESMTGQKIESRSNPRKVIMSGRHTLIWDDLDLLYFSGYACWNYFNTPFLFSQPNFKYRQLPDWSEGGRQLRRIELEFPDEIPTHCKKQIFYLDSFNRVVRFDYAPEPFASWAKAAHYCLEYQQVDGIWMATKRKVVPRNSKGRALLYPVLVWIDIKEFYFQ